MEEGEQSCDSDEQGNDETKPNSQTVKRKSHFETTVRAERKRSRANAR